MSRRTLYRYSPSLDGVRGTAMLLFMAFHFGLGFLQGAWVGINLFFVLSAYLITRLLIEERAQSGRVAILSFYRRRARRLLPALFILLTTLGLYGIFLAPDTVRGPLRGDIFATLFYVQNWHLVLRGDQYFELFDNPSFLRHAWTLSVEEQFYLFVPFVVLAVLRFIRRREAQAGLLITLGLLSALWTAHVGLATQDAQSHAYYGTDTRAQALCIGAALAFWMGIRRRRGDQLQLPRPAVAVLGWGGLAASIYAYVAVAPFQRYMYDGGGIFLFALAAAALVVGCADERESLLHTVLGWQPFAYLGRISYGLYLWHWPVLLWVQRARPGIGTVPTLLIGMSTTIAVAALSYQFIERPVTRGGVRALLPSLRTGRSLVAGGFAAILALAFAVGQGVTTASASELGSAVGRPVPMLISGTPRYVPAAQPTKVAIFGDSVPDLLIQRKMPGSYPDLEITNLAQPGCDLVQARYANELQSVQPAACVLTKQHLRELLKASGASQFVLFGGLTLAFPHDGAGGAAVSLDDPAYRATIVTALDTYRSDALAAGVRRMSVVTVPCREPDLSKWPPQFAAPFEGMPRIVEQVTRPALLNSVMTGWAAARGVHVIDLNSTLCPRGTFRARIHGVELYQDQVHFSVPATRMIWTWLGPQIRTSTRTATPRVLPEVTAP